MEIALQVLVTMLAGSTLIPVVFRGKMNHQSEIAFIIGGLMCLAFSILIVAKVNYFTITACVGAGNLILSKQGRAFLVEIAMMPFEFVAFSFRKVHNLFMEEKIVKDWQKWRDVRENLFRTFGGVQNSRME